MNPIFIDEILADCVTKTSTVLLSSLQAVNPDITGIYFRHGHPKEIIEELKSMSQSGNKKAERYPLVALFRDFPEERGVDAGIYSVPTLNIFIITITNPAYFTEDRKAKNFKPILYPILIELLNQMKISGRFAPGLKDVYQYTQIDHYFWGRESIYGAEANIFTDWIDCIELKNFKLPVYLNNCKAGGGIIS